MEEMDLEKFWKKIAIHYFELNFCDNYIKKKEPKDILKKFALARQKWWEEKICK